jgi:DNA-binding response OmpR family regulator
MEVLVVDDDPFILKLTSFVVEQGGYAALVADEADGALAIVKKRNPALVLLDISLPEINGFDLCRKIRSFSDVPIIFVTAHTEIQDKVTGLQIGGDDYIIKPYEATELLARIGAVLRRQSSAAAAAIARLSYDTLSLDPITQVVTIEDERECELTPIEFRMLHYFMQNPGRVLTTDQILKEVWGYSEGTSRNLVAVYIRRLRTKIEPSAQHPLHIKTVANLGYCFG